MAPPKDWKKSLASFKSHSEKKIQEVRDWLKKHDQIVSLTQRQQSNLEAEIDKMKAQVDRYEAAWWEYRDTILSEDDKLKDDEKLFDKTEEELDEITKTMQGVRDDAEEFIANSFSQY